MKRNNKEFGGAMLVVLFLTGILALALSSSLSTASNIINSTKNKKLETEDYYSVESAFHSVLNWMRENSGNLVSASKLARADFYSNYDFSAPSIASNDTAFSSPIMLRLNGTNNAPILTNDNSLGTASFPSDTFNAQNSFQSISVGNNLIKLSLVNAIPEIPGKDYGDTDNGNLTPETDFYPIYKIEAMSSLNQGTYLYGYVRGSVISSSGVGFFGEDFVEMRQGCDSYESDSGSYSSSNKGANCDVGSYGPINIHQNEAVYGDVTTTGAIGSSSPWGGDVCANFSSGCPDPGTSCQGASCSVPALPSYQSWVSYCPMNQGSLNVNRNTTLTIASDSASDKCWTTVSVGNRKELTLTSTSIPYFIDTFDIANNGSVNIQPDTAGGTVEIYVRNFDGDKFNGNQVFNMNNKPYQFKIHYLGTDDLTLNGTAGINAFIVAPNAGISIQGNFDFYGGIQAKSLTFTGNGSIHYDESGQETVLSDMTFSLKNIFQKYR